MRAFIHLHGYRVALNEDDIDRFNDEWPCSNLRGLRGVTFGYDARGDLVDIWYRNGNAERWDGPELVALSEDAQRYAESRQAFHNAGTLARRFTERPGAQ